MANKHTINESSQDEARLTETTRAAALRTCASRRCGTRQARAVMITELSPSVLIGRSRACLTIVGPGTVVGPVRQPATGPSGPPPAWLPPTPHPRPAGVRQAHPGPGVWLRLPPHRRCHLLGQHP